MNSAIAQNNGVECYACHDGCVHPVFPWECPRSGHSALGHRPLVCGGVGSVWRLA